MRVNQLNVLLAVKAFFQVPALSMDRIVMDLRRFFFLNEGSLINQKTAFLKMTKEIEKITVLFQIKSNPYLLRVHFKD